MEEAWYEKLIAKMLVTNRFVLSYEDYQVVIQYDLYKTKVQLTRNYLSKPSLLNKWFKKIIGLQKIGDFREFWESGNYFVVKGETYMICHLHSLAKIETLGNLFSEILQKMLEHDCFVITEAMYNIIKKYEMNKLLVVRHFNP